MTSPDLNGWTSRVIDPGVVGAEPEEAWKLDAYAQYRIKLASPGYPCFFGQGAEARGEMMYAFVRVANLSDLELSLRRFVCLLAEPEYGRASLAAFFEPDALLTSHTAFVDRFWRVLGFLRERDHAPRTERVPDDPLWEFSFEGQEMFVVAASPTYRRRRSRNLGPGLVLIFQPRSLFIDPATAQPIAPAIRRRIHARMLEYDGMPVHPDIGFYGDLANREWKQYALSDDNEPEMGQCPFLAQSSVVHES